MEKYKFFFYTDQKTFVEDIIDQLREGGWFPVED